MKYLLFAFGALCASHARTQVEMLWQYTYPEIEGEESRFVVVDSNLNVFTLGEFGTITKFTPLGDTIFMLPDTIPGFIPAGFFLDSENRLIAAGMREANSDFPSVKVQKMDLDGNLIWDFDLDLLLGNEEELNGVALAPSDHIYLTGYDGGQISGQFFSACISPGGDLLWKTNRTPQAWGDLNKGMDIVALDSNNVYAVGIEHRTSLRKDAIIIKYNSTGTILWHKKFSYQDWKEDDWGPLNTYGHKLDVDSAGNVYAICFDNDDSRSFFLKYNNLGTFQWATELDPALESYFETIDVHNGYLYLGGSEGTNYNYLYASAVKMDFSGSVVWHEKYLDDYVRTKELVRHGDGILLSGYIYSCNGCEWDFITIRFDETGTLDWTHELSTTTGMFSDEPFDICVDPFNAIYVTGHGNGTFHHSQTYKLFNCGQTTAGIEFENGSFVAPLYPDAYYSWYDDETNIVLEEGVENNEYTPLTTGDYCVNVVVGSCPPMAACYSLFYAQDPTLSITQELTISPNPATNQLIVRTTNSGETITYELYDLSGQLAITGNVQPGGIIDISMLQSGIYMIGFNHNGNYSVQKLIVLD